MYAVLETGGKQYRVTEGDVLFLERLKGEPGDDVRFDKILACSNEVETDFGRPYLDDASVDGKILGHGKNKKIIIFKYKAKKGYRKKQGHRQPYTKVRIERIASGKYGVASYVGDADAGIAGDNIAVEPDAADTIGTGGAGAADIIVDAANTFADGVKKFADEVDGFVKELDAFGDEVDAFSDEVNAFGDEVDKTADEDIVDGEDIVVEIDNDTVIVGGDADTVVDVDYSEVSNAADETSDGAVEVLDDESDEADDNADNSKPEKASEGGGRATDGDGDDSDSGNA